MLHRLSSQTLAEKTGVSGHNTNQPHAIRDNGGRHKRNNSYTIKLTLYKTWTFSYVRWTFFSASVKIWWTNFPWTNFPRGPFFPWKLFPKFNCSNHVNDAERFKLWCC